MTEEVRAFVRLVPHIRQSTLDVIKDLEVHGVETRIDLYDRSITCYIHKANRSKAPVIFEIHGGGFVLGDSKVNNAIRELLEKQCDVTVIGINYRKAPEHPYPAAVNDVLDIMDFFAKHADDYDIDTESFSLIGFSAGANLSTIAAMKKPVESPYKLKTLVLHYPFLDAHTPPNKKQSFPTDIPMELMETFNALYIPEDVQPNYPFISPKFATESQLKTLPETLIVTSKEDALCEEGLEFGEKLEACGVRTRFLSMEHSHHGYIEDYYNQAVFENLPPDKRALYDKDFPTAAKKAMDISVQHFKQVLT